MFNQLRDDFYHLPDYLWNLLLFGAAVLLGVMLKWLLAFLVKVWYAREGDYSLTRSVLRRMGRPITYFLPLVMLNMAVPLMRMPGKYYPPVGKSIDIGMIIAFCYILTAVVKVVEDYVYHAYDLKTENNLRARKVRTQLQFIRQLVVSIILILGACAVLLNFDGLRKIGAGLLTGVGVGGIIIGFAAQKSLGNLLAGFQIAFTQPLRIDDVLVVEGEWGKVEEITLTYVVLNIWDQRRLILPINYFIEKPFQNWTRTGSELMGTVFLYLDYQMPLEPLRQELTRILHLSPLWDKRINVLQVTNTAERNMEVRVLLSAQDSSKAFDLRCYVRENLVDFIQRYYPDCLPKNRLVMHSEPVAGNGAIPAPVKDGREPPLR